MLQNNADAHISSLGYLWFQEVAPPRNSFNQNILFNFTNLWNGYQPTAAEFKKGELLA